MVWEGVRRVRRIRVRRIEERAWGCGPCFESNIGGGGGGVVAAAAAVDEEAVGVGAVAEKENDVASIEALVLDVTAPAFGQNVALATIPVRVTEPPALSALVLETQRHPLALPSRLSQRQVLLRVLLRDHQSVQLPHVARRQWLLEHRLLFLVRSSLPLVPLGGGLGNHIVVVVVVVVVIEVEAAGTVGGGGLGHLAEVGSPGRGGFVVLLSIPPQRRRLWNVRR